MLYLLYEKLRAWVYEHGLDGPFGVLDQIEFRALAAAGLSFAIVLLMGKRVIALLARLKIGDAGLSDAESLRRIAASKSNTPTMGGILIAGAIFLSTFLLADISERWVQLGLVVLLWMAGVGAADDWLKMTAARRGSSRQGLHAWEKLVFQIGIGAIVGYFSYRAGLSEAPVDTAHVLNLPFQKTYESAVTDRLGAGVIVLPLGVFVVSSVLMIAGMSNAVNITDGMDGLASGISAVVALGLVVLALVAGRQSWAQTLLVPSVAGSGELAVLAGSMAGACLGFLWFNCSPAQVFMGDTGSLCLGGLIGYTALVVRQEAVVLLMSGVFLVEIASVVIQVGYFKSTGGKRVFRCAPYHHHLHLGGWTEQQIVARLWIVTVLLLVFALASIKVR
ncbi:MAG: phospho-N-acetylmuramoyl-pentapeptide-transferase [Planctomycetota bacterium]|nr:MAG: phospho-N-acetylmuramoyl-pentapeptide-transferase [Planctomycetota bacterium]